MAFGVRNEKEKEKEKTDYNDDAKIITTVAVCSALSLIAVSLRLASRRIKRITMGYDDYLIVFAWVFSEFSCPQCNNN